MSFAGARRGGSTRLFAITFRAQTDDGEPIVTSDVTGGDLDSFGALYTATVSDRRWVRVDAAVDAGEKLSMVAMSDDDPDVAYAAGGQRLDPVIAPVVRKTIDGGRTWVDVFRAPGNANVETGWSGYGGDMSWEYGEYALGLAVSRDTRRIVLTDLGFVHVSQDGGDHWRQAYVQRRDANPSGASTPPSRAYRTNGLEPISGWWLTFVDRDALFASLTDVRSARSDDAGRSWNRDGRNGLTLNTTYHVVRATDGTLYAATSAVHDLYESPYLRDSRIDARTGAIMQSSNGGATWSLFKNVGHPVVWLALDPNDDEAMYASVVDSVSGGIFRLSLRNPDAAEALPAPPRTHGHPFNVRVLDDGGIVATYAGHQIGNTRVFADRSGVFYLPKGASAWDDRSDAAMHFWTKDLVVDPRDRTQSTWWVAVFSHELAQQPTHSGGLYRTRDRGLTWQRVFDDYRVESCAFDPHRPDSLLVMTDRHGLWATPRSDADAPVFERIHEFPFRNPTRAFFDPYRAGVAWVLTFGGGIFRVTDERANE